MYMLMTRLTLVTERRKLGVWLLKEARDRIERKFLVVGTARGLLEKKSLDSEELADKEGKEGMFRVGEALRG